MKETCKYQSFSDIDDHVWRLPVELDGCLEWCRQLDGRSWWPCSRTTTSSTTTMFCRLSFSSLLTLGQVGEGKAYGWESLGKAQV